MARDILAGRTGPARRPAGKRAGRAHRHPGAYLMVLPSYVIYFVFVFIPVLVTVYLGFTNYDLYRTMDFIGFANYARMFEDEVFLIAAKNTAVYAVLTIVPQIAIGLVLAVVLNGKLPGNKFHRAAIYMPNVTSMVAISMVWLWIYDPSLGLLNKAIASVGLPAQRWLFDTDLALLSIIFMGVWKLVGYNMIIYIAGLQQIPEDLYEAATIDGASPVRRFLNITIPLLRPVTFFLFVIACVSSFSVFEQVNVMTQGGPMNATTTIVHQIYDRAFTHFQMGYASAMAVMLLIVTIAMTLLNFRYGNRGSDL